MLGPQEDVQRQKKIMSTGDATSDTDGALVSLPPLAQLPIANPEEYQGPTPWSNWVIKGVMMAGAFPAFESDAATETVLQRILELGIDTFVCLQAEFSLTVPEAVWRKGKGLRPYVRDAQKLLARPHQFGNSKESNIQQTRLDLLHLPIVDGSITSDIALSRLADDCCQRIRKGQKLYVHCWGGHGRTGTLVAVVLSRLYGLTAPEALLYTQATHDTRKCPQGVRSPQTQVQIDQVRRIISNTSLNMQVTSVSRYYQKENRIIQHDIHTKRSKIELSSGVSINKTGESSKEPKSPVINIKAKAGIIHD